MEPREEHTTLIARTCKALGNPVRLRIAQALAHRRELSGQQLRDLFPLTQPTMSLHFLRLVTAGIIHVRKRGARNFYTLDQRLLRRHGISLA